MQPRHLAICRALKLFLIAISTDPRQLGGSIENVLGSSIASRQLVDRSSFLQLFVELSFDRSSIVASVDVVFLDTFLYRCLNTFICRDLLTFYIKVQRDPVLTFLNLSFNRIVFSPPKPLSLSPNFFLKVSSRFYKFFFTW